MIFKVTNKDLVLICRLTLAEFLFMCTICFYYVSLGMLGLCKPNVTFFTFFVILFKVLFNITNGDSFLD